MIVRFVCMLLVALGTQVQCQDTESSRVNCLPDKVHDNQDEELCQTRGCLWSPPSQDTAAPSCYFPSDLFKVKHTFSR